MTVKKEKRGGGEKKREKTQETEKKWWETERDQNGRRDGREGGKEGRGKAEVCDEATEHWSLMGRAPRIPLPSSANC